MQWVHSNTDCFKMWQLRARTQNAVFFTKNVDLFLAMVFGNENQGKFMQRYGIKRKLKKNETRERHLWANVPEGHTAIVLVDEISRDASIQYFSKYRRTWGAKTKLKCISVSFATATVIFWSKQKTLISSQFFCTALFSKITKERFKNMTEHV